MADDPRVQALLEELIDSDSTPEAVCASCVELLPVVKARWRQMSRVRDELDALFPPATDSHADARTPIHDSSLPDVPGYEVMAVLGRGGMGIVFEARHMGLNRIVALKMLLAGPFAGPVERARLRREAEAVAALQHPNIVQVHDFGDSGGRPYFTMEYVDGGSLANRLNGTPVPGREAAAMVAILAGAVHAAHLGGIVHRDLKPSNVLLTADGTPKVSDFGLARRIDGDAPLTQTGIAVGTPNYMAPEQTGEHPGIVGPPADVYALGAILYEMLTGRPPFRGETAAATLYQVLTQDPVPPARINSRVPRDLETVCLQCLRKDPRGRYDTAAALADDLTCYLRGEAITARPEGRVGRAVRRVRRKPLLSAALAVSGILAAILVGLGLWMTAERAATERAARDDLDLVRDSLRRSAWPEAKAAMDRARVRLDGRPAPELRARLARGGEDADLAERLEKIRLDAAVVVDGVLNLAQADAAYQVAFGEFGLGQAGDDPDAVAARVRDSDVCAPLLAALDDWSVVAQDPARKAWAMAVAGRAEPNPTPWRRAARDPAVRKDRAALVRLLGEARVADESVPLLLALSTCLVTVSEPPPPPLSFLSLVPAPAPDSEHQIPFLAGVQRAHPSDLWANLILGNALLFGQRPGDSTRYFQAVVALRPGLAVGHHALGMALSKAAVAGSPQYFDDAIREFHAALHLDPASFKTRLVLIGALGAAKRNDEAIAHARLALGSGQMTAVLHTAIGANLDELGRSSEAVDELRHALALKPDAYLIQITLRNVLTKQRRWAEAQPVWKSALDSDPPRHDQWYGYAELCLYLGLDAEYKRTRHALLTRFGAEKDVYVAERTARACLLLPAAGDDLTKAVALADLAGSADRKQHGGPYPYFQFVKGLAEYRQGRFSRTIDVMRGDAARSLGPAPQLVLAMALHRSGRPAEARTTLQAAVDGHDWSEANVHNQDGWICHVLRREAEGLIGHATPERKPQP